MQDSNLNYTIYYCYDAYCGWCYGNTTVIKALHDKYGGSIHFEVLSGGMVMPEKAQHIGIMANYIKDAYKRVEEYTGIQFGEDYLWHINNPDLSDWFPHSEKPAIALSIFKEIYPEQQVAFASDLLYALHYEGRDLTDNEAYRHLLEKYTIDADNFYNKLKSDEHKDKSHYEFAMCKQLQVNGYPSLLLQTGETKFYLLSNGYTSLENIETRIQNIVKQELTK